MVASLNWLAGPLVALLKPAAEAVVGDWYRRWKIENRYRDNKPSRHSPVLTKAISDLEGFVARQGILTDSISDFLGELKSTGALHQIARNAFYELNDEAVRIQFEAMLSRHLTGVSFEKQKEFGREFFDSVIFILRESLRAQTNDDLLYLFDQTKNGQIEDDIGKRNAILREIRPEIAKAVPLSVRSMLVLKDAANKNPTGYEKEAYPAWLYIEPEKSAGIVAAIAGALVKGYETIRVDGPAQRSVDCQIDKLYVTARLRAADFNLRQNSFSNRIYPERNYSEIIGRISQCAILGDPGGGKSTLAQRMCLDLDRAAEKDGRLPLAVKVEIRRLRQRSGASSFQTLIHFLAQELARQTNLHFDDQEWTRIVHHLLFFGRLFVVFDGIDEIVSSSARREVIKATTHLSNVFMQNRFVFTCRKTDFQTTPISGPDIYLLQQFNKNEVGEYFRSASRWVFERSDAEIELHEPGFLSQAEAHAAEFIRNPLLLALIVWIYSVGQRIPDNRIELYAECSDLLFRRWDSLKEIDPELPDPHWLFQLVTEIAHGLYLLPPNSGPPNQDWLKQQVLDFFRKVYEIDAENRAHAAADKFVNHLIGRSWILQERTAGSFEFSHRTFMEYYYARWLDDSCDGIEPLLELARPHILAGEQFVPLQLAFQMKVSGKLRSAEALTSLFVDLIRDVAHRPTDVRSLKKNSSSPLVNAVTFVIASIGYLQPSEIWMTRIAKEISLAMKTKDEWSGAIAALVDSSTAFRASIADGVRKALSEVIVSRKGHSIGFAVDWLYACYLSSREIQSITFSQNVLKYGSVQERFDPKSFAASGDGYGSSSIPKMVFDLTQTTLPSVGAVGLAMWSSSIVPDRRLDWRFIDFSLGAIECAMVLLGNTEDREVPYANLFVGIAPKILEQKNSIVSGGKIVMAKFDYQPVLLATNKIPTGPIDTVVGLLIAVIGTSELLLRFPNQEEFNLGVPAPVGSLDHSHVLNSVKLALRREDLSQPWRNYFELWLAGRLRMFQKAASLKYVPAERAFIER